MIYCPMIKTKNTEKKAMIFLSDYFDNEGVIPYIEIIDAWVYKKKDRPTGKVHYVVLDDYLSPLKENQSFFLSIFHTPSIIKSDTKSVYLQDLNQHEEKYAEQMRFLTAINNAIPVFEIRSEDNLEYAQEYMRFIREKGIKLAIRFTCASKAIINWASEIMGQEDYAFFDVDLSMDDESNYLKRKLLFDKLHCKLVPIRTNRTNESPLLDQVEQIKALWSRDSEQARRVIYPDSIEWVNQWNSTQVHLAGWADYAGLKNNLTTKGGGQTRKYALIYSREKKTYRLYSTKNASDQFSSIYELFFKERSLLDPKEICPAYRLVSSWEKGHTGSFSTWNAVSLVRYVSQVSDAIRKLPEGESSI